jgi:hypothetical protein
MLDPIDSMRDYAAFLFAYHPPRGTLATSPPTTGFVRDPRPGGPW